MTEYLSRLAKREAALEDAIAIEHLAYRARFDQNELRRRRAEALLACALLRQERRSQERRGGWLDETVRCTGCGQLIREHHDLTSKDQERSQRWLEIGQ